MIEKLRSTLEKIRQAREEELHKNAPHFLGEEEYRRQHALLTLELPFSTHIKDTMEVSGEIIRERIEKCQGKRQQSAYKTIQKWIKSGKPEEIEIRKSFCTFLKNCHVLSYHHDLGNKAEVINTEELSKIMPVENMRQCIDLYPPDPNLQQVYLDYTENLSSFINKGLYLSFPIPKKKPLSLTDAEKLFEYLECRALKSTTVRTFTDILLCRALFYAPLPAKKLFALGPPEKKAKRWYVYSDTASFQVPNSFVLLWKEMSLGKQLLPREFDEDQLSKKISRLGKYAGLSTALNPSILRLSLEATLSELGPAIDDVIMQNLPPR